LSLDPSNPKLTQEQKDTLAANIQLLRDAIVFFTATGAARGVSGHTGRSVLISTQTDTYQRVGGAYDTVPEVCMILAMFEHAKENYVPIIFDEAGRSYIFMICCKIVSRSL
jgi:hypothetical protein